MAKTAASAKVKKPVLFQRKSRFDGAHSRLEVFAKQKGPEQFIVFVLHRKGGGDKKNRGMVSEFKTVEETQQRFDEIVAQSKAAGWTETVTWMKSAFTSVPSAE